MEKLIRSVIACVIFCGSLVSHAQYSLPADFEIPGEDTMWTMFANGQDPDTISITANPGKSAVNPSDHCLKFLVSEDADRWVGAYSDYYDPIEVTEEIHMFYMLVYKDVISPVSLKLESSLTGSDPVSIKSNNTVTEEWELITFDFSQAIGHIFGRITFFPDFPETDRESGSTCYIDLIGHTCKISGIQFSSGITPPVCHGGSDGMIQTTVSGTYPPFTYQWSNGNNTGTLENVIAGNYTLELFDSKGCSETYDFTIPEPDPIAISERKYEPLCHGDANGAIRIMPSGGEAPFDILWNNDDTSDSLFNLPAGCYTVAVTDAHNCEGQKEICLEEPDALILELSKQDNVCHGDSTGSVFLLHRGGTPPFEILVNGNAEAGNLSNLQAGGYQVEITDAHGCSASESITLIDPEKIAISDITGASQVVSFQNLIYSVTDQDGYTFHWMAEGGNVITGQGSNVVAIQWGSGTTGAVRAVAESELGCTSDTVTLQVSIGPTGVPSHPADMVRIYPNPVGDRIFIDVPASEIYSLEISSVNGNILYKEDLLQGDCQVDLTSFNRGLYILTLRTDQFAVSQKMVKLE